MAGRTALARVMEHQGRRQDWLARQTGFSPTYITYLYTGRRQMSANAAERIGAALGVLPETLTAPGTGRDTTDASSDAD